MTAIVDGLEGTGKTTMIVAQGDKVVGVLGLSDRPRASVASTLVRLLDMGVKKLVMLTGDNPKAAQFIAGEVGLTDVRAGLLPEEKLSAIQALEQEYGAIAMTGDGVNDAPDSLEAIKYAYGIYAEKVESDTAAGYLVDHTASTSVMDKSNRIRLNLLTTTVVCHFKDMGGLLQYDSVARSSPAHR